MISMLPDPLHPAIVHLPIALAVLVPVGAILATVLIHKRFFPTRVWGAVVLLQLVLVASAWAALETGEDQEDRVEKVVAKRHVERHEEAAERFLLPASLGLGAVATGLLPHRSGRIGRIAGTLASCAVLGAAIPVGQSGGELVYKHGAANAYLDLDTVDHPDPDATAEPDERD